MEGIDDDSWNEFQKSLKKAGLDKYVEIKSAGVDQYYAK